MYLRLPSWIASLSLVLASSVSAAPGYLGFQPAPPAPPTVPSAPKSSVPAGYHLTFDEEFDSLSIADSDAAKARWYSQTVHCCMQDFSFPNTPTASMGIDSPEGQNPFSLIPGGGLDIRLQKTNGKWFSGILATVNGKGEGFSQRYGYFEMKAQFPPGEGTWPAFWLMNTSSRSENAPAGEIDVVESYMFAPRIINIILHDWTPPSSEICHKIAKVADLTKGFHTFAMLWTPSMMTFYCDGEILYKYPTPPIMHQPYYPIIDLGLGGGWVTKRTPQRSDMLVKYVRVYASDKAEPVR